MIKVTLAQLSPTAGDLVRNRDKILLAAEQGAEEEHADIVLTPEMSLTGYPIDDLIGDANFKESVRESLAYLADTLPSDTIVAVGTPQWLEDLPEEISSRIIQATGIDSEKRNVVNTLTLFRGKSVIGYAIKKKLPTYGVFDDSRWFAPNPDESSPVIEIDGTRIGFAICEDVWDDRVINSLNTQGVDVVLVANASPYTEGKQETRLRLVSEHAKRLNAPVAYVNMTGGQDEVVYDGASFVLDRFGDLTTRLPAFESFTHTVSIPTRDDEAEETGPIYDYPETNEATYTSLRVGLKDYVNRVPGISGLVIGLSGGLDSALAAAIAVDAVGSHRVVGIAMPGPYSSKHSVTDALELARNLDIEVHIAPIGDTFDAEIKALGNLIEGPGKAVAIENIQARLRAIHLMTVANTRGMIVLNTGNKSEASVGYFTLGGDSSGGFAILKDIYKTRAYDLAKWRNSQQPSGSPLIPVNTIAKPPSAELAPGQEDTDSLPPYPVLDTILEMWLEDRATVELISETISRSFDVTDPDITVRRVISMTLAAEHKRRQVAPGVKITDKSYGKDRRYPIVNMYRP